MSNTEVASVTAVITSDGVISVGGVSVAGNEPLILMSNIISALPLWNIPPLQTSRDEVISALNSGKVDELVVVILPITITGKAGKAPRDKVCQFTHNLLTPERHWTYLDMDRGAALGDVMCHIDNERLMEAVRVFRYLRRKV